ncbi:hypothetical protein ACFV0Z_12780 [Streptomyces xiamenensis]
MARHLRRATAVLATLALNQWQCRVCGTWIRGAIPPSPQVCSSCPRT